MSDQIVAVNQELVILLAATDADGDELRYSFSTDVPDIGRRAAISPLPLGAGEFRWLPLAADVGVWTFRFTVSDGTHEDSTSARVEVRPAVGEGSAPRFLHPQGMGTTLDLSRSGCLELPVEVADADSTEVTLSQLQPVIDGSELTQTDALRGTWRWCPSPAQIEADDRYTAYLAADDHDNPLAVHPYLIVLLRPAEEDCPGDAPLIQHEPVDLTTSGTIALSAFLSDDQGLDDEPLLYASTTDPGDPPDLGGMAQHTMRLVAGDMRSGSWSALLPNPVAGQDGASTPLYYVIVAVDADDEAGACDHQSRAPPTGAFRVNVTGAAGEGGGALCDPCEHDAQCGGLADLCAPAGSSGAFCLSACGDAGECPDGYACSALPVQSTDGVSARQCLPLSGECGAP